MLGLLRLSGNKAATIGFTAHMIMHPPPLKHMPALQRSRPAALWARAAAVSLASLLDLTIKVVGKLAVNTIFLS